MLFLVPFLSIIRIPYSVFSSNIFRSTWHVSIWLLGALLMRQIPYKMNKWLWSLQIRPKGSLLYIPYKVYKGMMATVAKWYSIEHIILRSQVWILLIALSLHPLFFLHIYVTITSDDIPYTLGILICSFSLKCIEARNTAGWSAAPQLCQAAFLHGTYGAVLDVTRT